MKKFYAILIILSVGAALFYFIKSFENINFSYQALNFILFSIIFNLFYDIEDKNKKSKKDKN